MTDFTTHNEIAIDANSDNESSVTTSAISDFQNNVTKLLTNFPKTRYYGSKRRLLTWIYESVKELPFDTVLDAFGGTASVSLLFKTMGKKVTFNDALLCNTISAKAILANDLTLDLQKAFNFIDEITPINGFISKTFGGMYYTNAENSWLDAAAFKIHELNDPLQRSVYLYCLFQACLMKRPFNLFHRANLNLRINQNIKRSFGNHVTWEHSFQKLMKNQLGDLLKFNRTNLQPVNILEYGDIARIKSGYDLVYLDPPYVNYSNNGDNYLKRYHFLEGLSDYKNWADNIDASSKIKSFKPNAHITEWQDKKIFQEKLFNTINAHKQSIVVLSYLSGAYPSEEDITNCFKNNFESVSVLKKDFCHALAKEKKVELLFIGRNL